MKLHRFFLGPELTLKAGHNAPIHAPSLELLNQLKKVFRLSTGDKVILFDNSGYDYAATIEGFDKEGVSFAITDKKENKVHASRETYLFASIVKKDTFEWIAEKATELGVSHIVPVISDRTEKKDLNQDRLRKIVQEAAEQSGRATMPEIHPIIKLEEALTQFNSITSIAWNIEAEKFSPADIAEKNPIGIYIGPEGGWTEKELQMFNDHGVPLRSLGPQVLRAETAVIATLSQLVF